MVALYVVFGLMTIVWAYASGTEFDGWLIAFIGACVVAPIGLVAMPWHGHAPFLVRFAGVAAALTQVVFLPLFVRSPVLLMALALGAFYVGMTQTTKAMVEGVEGGIGEAGRSMADIAAQVEDLSRSQDTLAVTIRSQSAAVDTITDAVSREAEGTADINEALERLDVEMRSGG